jgi:hypothetical protein
VHGCINFQKSCSHLKILGAQRVIRSKFHTEGPQILGATVHNVASTTNWRPRFVRPWRTEISFADEAVNRLQWCRVQPHTKCQSRIRGRKEDGLFWPFLSLFNTRSRSTHSSLGERSSYSKTIHWTHSLVQITQGISMKSAENSLSCTWPTFSLSFSPFLRLWSPRLGITPSIFVAHKTIYGHRPILTSQSFNAQIR